MINDGSAALKMKDDESHLEYKIKDIENESLKINSKRLRDKYIEKVVEIHQAYKQKNTFMIKIFPFNEIGRNLVEKIKYT